MAKKNINPQDLGINLNRRSEKNLFKWFLACLLFGRPIQQEVAVRTFKVFIDHGYTNPQKFIDTKWDRLVKLLDKGHYVRFDYSTATKLHEIMKYLVSEYGDMKTLIEKDARKNELKKRLLDFKGIGPKTTEIFLRGIENLVSE